LNEKAMEEDLPEEIRKEMKIHPVSNLDEALEIVFPSLKKKEMLPAGPPPEAPSSQAGAPIQ